jgi:hypothetical protein
VKTSGVVETASYKPFQQMAQIDPEGFFRDFLGIDPKYGVVAPILERLRRKMSDCLEGGELSLSEFIDITSITYDEDGKVIPKDEEILRALARAMKQIDISREVLKAAASSSLTLDQIAEGPTSIKIPVSALCNDSSFYRFLSTLSEQYHQCRDFRSLIYSVSASKVHQKPIFLLFENDATIIAYFSPAWSMEEMTDRIVLSRNRMVLDIYNAKTSIQSFCTLVPRTATGHVKILYLGKRRS